MDILVTLQEILVKDYKVPKEKLAPDAHLSELGIDSLGMLELMFKIEDNFHLKIPGDTPTDLVTVQDVCSYIEGLVADQQRTQQSTQESTKGSALSPDVES
jgi:acyl carrier protein